MKVSPILLVVLTISAVLSVVTLVVVARDSDPSPPSVSAASTAPGLTGATKFNLPDDFADVTAFCDGHVRVYVTEDDPDAGVAAIKDSELCP